VNVKYMAKFGGSALSAGSAVRRLSKARNDQDRLLMLDAAVSILAAAVAIAIVVRDMRADRDSESRVIDLEDHR
jgi:hypothetical protein